MKPIQRHPRGDHDRASRQAGGVGMSMNEDQLIKRIKAHIAKGDQAKEKADQHYTAAGIHLKELRDGSPSKAAWEKLIKSRCGIGTSRAYELIAIADGRKTAEELRLGTAARVRKHAEKHRSRPLANGQNKAAEPPPASSIPSGQKNLPAKVEPNPEPNVKPKPTATTTKSWKVEVIAKDGKRYGNGIRFETEEEADFYRITAAINLHEGDNILVATTEVIRSDEPPSGAHMDMKRTRRGNFTYDLIFADGTCHTLGWEEIATPASGDNSEANPLVEAWDKAGPKQRHDFVLARRVEIMKAQQQIGWFAHGDIPPSAPAAWIKKETGAAPSEHAVAAADDLDIPNYLRRTPEAA
jgi:hypothetical protein